MSEYKSATKQTRAEVRDMAATRRRKPYIRPAIIYEAKLETQAGSPLEMQFHEHWDPFNLEPKP